MRCLAALLALLACTSAASAHARCSGEGCGDEFIAQGWTKIAQCDGHNWSYLLQRSGSIVICGGVSGRAGPVEFPCQIFKGNLAHYRMMSAMRPDERVGTACVLGFAATGIERQ